MDIVFIAVLFIYIGHIIKENEVFYYNNQTVISICSAIIWTTALEYGIYIEIGARSFLIFGLSIIEAVCGSICILHK
jgi:hypothetical protein